MRPIIKRSRGSKKRVGRPSKFTKNLGDKICAELALGKSVKCICDESWAPCVETFYSWLRSNKEFLEQYNRAKEDGAEAIFEEVREIAEDSSNDFIEIRDERNEIINIKPNHAAVQRSKLKVDTYKWMLSKISPKKYGEKVTIGSGDDSLKVDHRFAKKSDEELYQIAAQLLNNNKDMGKEEK